MTNGGAALEPAASAPSAHTDVNLAAIRHELSAILDLLKR
jgi:hypothetical protein